MTTKLEYHRAIKTLSTHGLLSLYSQIANQKHIATTEKKNQILRKYLKSIQKNPLFQPARSEIKTLYHYTTPIMVKNVKMAHQVDKKFEALLERALIEEAAFSDADWLYAAMNDLFEHHGICSTTTPENRAEIEPNTMYISMDDIADAMPDNKQIKPLLCEFVCTNVAQWELAATSLKDDTYFDVLDVNQTEEHGHIVFSYYLQAKSKSKTLSLNRQH